LDRDVLFIILSLIILWFVWGTNAWATKIAIDTIPPLLMSGLCYTIAGAIFICLSLIFQHIRNQTSDLDGDVDGRKRSILIGSIMLLGGQGMRTVGEVQLSSGMTSLIFAIVPLWVIIIGWVYFKNFLTKTSILAIIIGFSGVLLIVLFSIIDSSDDNNLEGILFLIGASLLWAVGSSYMNKDNKLVKTSLLFIGRQMLIGGILLSSSGILLGESNNLNLLEISFQSFLGMLYMILLGSLIGYPIFVWLLNSTSQVMANSFTFVTPVISLVIGIIFLKESIFSSTIVAAIMILGSVITIMTIHWRKEVKVINTKYNNKN